MLAGGTKEHEEELAIVKKEEQEKKKVNLEKEKENVKLLSR